jgi:hypothetical protein
MNTKKIGIVFAMFLFIVKGLFAQIQVGTQLEKAPIDSLRLLGANPKGTADGRPRYLTPAQFSAIKSTQTVAAGVISSVTCTNFAYSNGGIGAYISAADGLFYVTGQGCAIKIENVPSVASDTRIGTGAIVNDSLAFTLLNVTTGAVTPNYLVIDNAVPRVPKINKTVVSKPYPYVASALTTLTKAPVIGNGGVYDVEVEMNGVNLEQGVGFTITAAGAIALTFGNTATSGGTMTADKFVIKHKSLY